MPDLDLQPIESAPVPGSNLDLQPTAGPVETQDRPSLIRRYLDFVMHPRPRGGGSMSDPVLHQNPEVEKSLLTGTPTGQTISPNDQLGRMVDFQQKVGMKAVPGLASVVASPTIGGLLGGIMASASTKTP